MNRAIPVLAKLGAVVAILVSVTLAGPAAHASDIVEVKLDNGVVAWLKHEPSIPIVAVSALWTGAGAAAEPAGKDGRANMLAAMLDEGAGDLDSQAFQQTLDDNAVRLSFEAGRDSFSMSLQTLADNAADAFQLAGLALLQPRFDAAPLERMRAGTLNSISRDSRNPNAIAGRAFSAEVFGDDRYGRPVVGTSETVAALSANDLKAHLDDLLAQDNLVIGVVGDVTAEQLRPLLQAAFGALPKAARGAATSAIAPAANGQVKLIDHASPQTVFVFGLPGIKRNDPDYDVARVMNHMLGGGGFSSMLTEEIREKRGLTYGVYSYLRPMDRTGLWLGGLSTSNNKAAEALQILKSTITRFRDDGPSPDRLEKAKANINGAFPLRFTSNSAIARLLVAIQRYDLGQDYLLTRSQRISAVSPDDIRRVAARMLDLDRLTVIAVGRPDGLTGSATR
jgi:zinc protease